MNSEQENQIQNITSENTKNIDPSLKQEHKRSTKKPSEKLSKWSISK